MAGNDAGRGVIGEHPAVAVSCGKVGHKLLNIVLITYWVAFIFR